MSLVRVKLVFMRKTVLLYLFMQISCSNIPINHPKLDLSALSLNYKPRAGQIEVISNCYVTTTKTFIKNELSSKRIEATDFKTKIITLKNEPTISQMITTFYKDGSALLKELALPELNEQILFNFMPNGKILKAGDYPKNSLYFVPSLPLPNMPVKIGGSWEVENSWHDTSTKKVMRSKIKAKLKSVKQCGQSKCGEIIFEGSIENFSSKLSGQFLFDLEHGLLVHALFEADEQMHSKEVQVVVKSRLRSYLLQPQGYYIADHAEQVCPSETMEE